MSVPDEHARAVTDVRAHLSDVIEQVRREHEPVYMTRNGRPVAAVIDAEDLAHLIVLAEDAEDLRAAAEARAELAAGAAPIPWEKIKADLGLV